MMQGADLLGYQCYFREGKPEFYDKCRVLLYDVEAADSVCKCFIALSRHPTVIYLPVYRRKHCNRTFFTQNGWKIQIQRPNLSWKVLVHLDVRWKHTGSRMQTGNGWCCVFP